MIDWKTIEEKYHDQYIQFQSFIGRWLIENYEDEIPPFTISGFFKLPTPLQLGFFYGYLAREVCHVSLEVTDQRECADFVLEFFQQQYEAEQASA